MYVVIASTFQTNTYEEVYGDSSEVSAYVKNTYQE